MIFLYIYFIFKYQIPFNYLNVLITLYKAFNIRRVKFNKKVYNYNFTYTLCFKMTLKITVKIKYQNFIFSLKKEMYSIIKIFQYSYSPHGEIRAYFYFLYIGWIINYIWLNMKMIVNYISFSDWLLDLLLILNHFSLEFQFKDYQFNLLDV